MVEAARHTSAHQLLRLAANMSTSPVCRCPRGTGELPSRLLAAKSAAASGHMPPATRPESPDTSTQRTKSVRSSRGIPVVMPLDPQQTSEDNAAPEEADHPPGTGRPESDDLRAAPAQPQSPRAAPPSRRPGGEDDADALVTTCRRLCGRWIAMRADVRYSATSGQLRPSVCPVTTQLTVPARGSNRSRWINSSGRSLGVAAG